VIAAITAGGRVTGELATAIGTDVKALARVGKTSLLETAIEAARGAGASTIAVIGGQAVREQFAARVDRVIDESPDGGENVRRAIEAATDEPLLLLTSDMPFVEASDVAAFLAAARAMRADAALPLAEADAYLRAYPGAPPHLTRLGNVRVANGSVVYFGPGVAPRILDTAQRLFAARKSLVRMAALLGPPLLARFAIGRLRIEHVEARAQTLLGIRARAIRDASPGLCFDVDTIDDYRYAVAFRH
jgi:CTP:molybdopterin cytidylyltransferase MocA